MTKPKLTPSELGAIICTIETVELFYDIKINSRDAQKITAMVTKLIQLTKTAKGWEHFQKSLKRCLEG